MPRQHPFFAALSDAHWALLKPHITESTYPANAVVLPAEATSTDLYWIGAGNVEVSRETVFGPQLFASLTAPQFFGEMGFIDGKSMQTEIKTCSPTTLYQLSGAVLWKLFAQDDTLATHFYRSFWPALTHKLNLANQQLKQFFKQGPPTPVPLPAATEIETPNRPAWFTPPQTPPPSSMSLDAIEINLDDAEKHAVLRNIGLSQTEIELLFARGEEVAIPANQVIFREGDFGDTLYLILQGAVRISKYIPGVGEEALAVLETGDIFGEMALVASNAVRSADCFAHEQPAVLLAFRLRDLQSMKNHPEELAFLQALCKMMAHRVRESYSKLISWKMMRGGFF